MKAWLRWAWVLAAAAALVATVVRNPRRDLLRPLAAEYHFRAGWRALNRANAPRAERHFRRAQQRAARPGEMAGRIGLAYLYLDQALRAERWLERAVEIDRRQPAIVYSALGRARWRAGDVEAAAALLERAAALAPDNPLALNELGYLYAESGIKLDRAVALLRRARILAQHAPREIRWTIDDSLGWAYYQRGDHRAALPLLESAHSGLNARETTQAEIAYHLGMTYLALDRRSDAVPVLMRSAEAGSKPARAVLAHLGVAR